MSSMRLFDLQLIYCALFLLEIEFTYGRLLTDSNSSLLVGGQEECGRVSIMGVVVKFFMQEKCWRVL